MAVAVAGFAITFGGGPFVSDLAENRSETVSDLSENRSEAKVGDTRPGQEPKENTQRGFTGGGLITALNYLSIQPGSVVLGN